MLEEGFCLGAFHQYCLSDLKHPFEQAVMNFAPVLKEGAPTTER